MVIRIKNIKILDAFKYYVIFFSKYNKKHTIEFLVNYFQKNLSFSLEFKICKIFPKLSCLLL